MESDHGEIPQEYNDKYDDDDQKSEVVDYDTLTFFFITCKICMKPLTNPTSLPCGHNFCKICVTNQLSNTKDNSRCACKVCGARYTEFMKNNGASRMGENALLEIMLRIFEAFFRENPQERENIVTQITRPRTHASNMDISAEMENMYHLLTTRQDIDRVGWYIRQLQQSQCEAYSMMTRLNESIKHTGDLHPANMNMNDRLHLVNLQTIRAATREFPSLTDDAYGIVFVQTTRDDFATDKGLHRLHDMPLRGITALPSLVIFQCIAQDMDKVIALFDTHNLKYEAVVAIWQPGHPNLATTSRAIATRKVPTYFFVAGSVGPSRVFNERNTQNRVITCNAPASAQNPHDNLPLQLFSDIASTMSTYTSRCIINSTMQRVPPNWDIQARPADIDEHT